MLEVRGLLGGLKARYAARRVPCRVVEAAFGAWQESSLAPGQGAPHGDTVAKSAGDFAALRSECIAPCLLGGGSAAAAPGTVVGGGRTRGVGRTGSIHSPPPHDLDVGGTTQILRKSGQIRDGRGRIHPQGRRLWGIRHHLEVREARLTMSRQRGQGVGEEPLPVGEGA
jgi:hypothetical protein